MKIAVGSENQSKISAVKTVFEYFYDSVEVSGVKIMSQVSDQPLSIDETYQGAYNRAQGALKSVEHADFGVGIEGGVTQYSFGFFKSALVVIVDKHGKTGVGRTGGLVLPKSVSSEILKGKNLSDVTDSLFGTTQVGKGQGFFGVITSNFLSRSSATEHGIAFALSRFIHPTLWE